MWNIESHEGFSSLFHKPLLISDNRNTLCVFLCKYSFIDPTILSLMINYLVAALSLLNFIRYLTYFYNLRFILRLFLFLLFSIVNKNNFGVIQIHTIFVLCSMKILFICILLLRQFDNQRKGKYFKLHL